MRILYIHQYFKTPAEPGGTRSYWIAKALIENGHDVTMLTSSDSQTTDFYMKTIDNIKVASYAVKYNQSMSIKDRLKSFLGFMWHSSRYALQHSKQYDVIIATSTPLTVGIPALLAKKIKKKKYLFEVRDLWPEVPIQMGAFKNPLLIKAMRLLEKKIYVNAEHVVALSPGMQDGVVQYIDKSKTSMIPNMSKKDAFWIRKKDITLYPKLGLDPESFKVIHFGALGVANGADYIIEAATLLKEDPSIEFVFVGGGATEDDLRAQCKIRELTNVKFLGRYPMDRTSEIVNLCDVSLVSFKNLPILYTNSPNKLFDSLSAGKPIIVNSAGWTKELVETYRCGVYADPESPADLVLKIKALQGDSELLKKMGEQSRWLAENVYDKSILAREFVNTFEKYV
ncbi:glycosyltransferase family 4 protein [Sphingobacterium bambusae]|uniref:Glycosyltransferase family 4 protein n=1 Tax=Sphingobacterium bambusae TaxID=662858 RepID=A0ABW6BB06_9SPHI|nr:glycosyltransferase family 4 protein [Sphingobacterium bambusae]WPL46858.1 glycosyltransferase family 4 protein [Sphingobacterium bambusae]